MTGVGSSFAIPGVVFDDLGPRRVLTIHDPSAGLDAVVVIDTLSGAPSGGGVRMAPDVSLAEVARLARAMTFKYALLSMPIGGAKAGIRFDPAHPDRGAVVRAFVEAIDPLVRAGVFVPGPDMGTSASDFGDGPPVDERLTGYGVVVAAEAALEERGRGLEGARVAIEGFGKVGMAAARFFADEGARLVAASTARATVYAAAGLDVEVLIALRERYGDAGVEQAPGVAVLPREALFGVAADVLVPGARPDAIHLGNVEELDTTLVVPASNAPYAEGTLEALEARGVVAIPDFVANAGGVLAVVAAIQGLDESASHGLVRGLISSNVRRVLERARARSVHPYAAAVEIAHGQVAAG